MVAVLVSLLLHAAAPTVTYTSRGTTVGAMLTEISKQTGVQMGAVPETKDEIVIVSVHDAPLKDFQLNLSQAIGAKWRTSGGVARLVRPIELDRAQERAERQLRIAEVTAGIAKLRKRVSQQPEFDAKTAQTTAQKLDDLYTKYKGHLSDSPGLEAVVAIEPQTPSGRLAIAAVSSLSISQIADVGPTERIVYSTSPTAVQRPMPGDFSAAIQRFQEEQQLYTDALKRLPIGQSPYYGSKDISRTGPDDLASVMLITSRSPYNPSLSVSVRLVRKDGTIANGARSLLNLEESTMTTPPIADGKVPLSPTSLQFMASIAELQKGKSFLTDKDLIEKLTNPEKTDPLSYIAAEGVLALGSEKNTIACVPDSGFLEPAFTAVDQGKTLDLNHFSNWLTVNCDVKHEGSWLVATPKRMIETRALRVDRAIFGQFLRRSIANNGIVLEDLSNFVGRMPYRYMDSLVPMVAFLVLPDLIAAVDEKTVELLRVYGRLRPEQLADLQALKTVQVGSLDPASIADLNHLVFRADPAIGYTSRSRQFVESTLTEVTCAMPNGVPPDATLSMNTNSQDAVIVDGGGNPGGNYQPLNAYQLALNMVRAERADPTDKRETTKAEKYRFGHIRSILLEVNFTPSIQSSGNLKETNFPRKDDSVTFDQLPDSFKQAVTTALTQARTQLGATPKTKSPPP